MKNLKLNELSKQQMNQITGGRETETTTIDGKQVKRSYDCTWIYTPYGPKEGRKNSNLLCLWMCVCQSGRFLYRCKLHCQRCS